MLKFTKREELILLVIIITILIGSGIVAVNYLRQGSGGVEFRTSEEELKLEPQEEELEEDVEESLEEILIQIGGEVRRPGVYKLEIGSRLFELIDEAGGPNSRANLDSVNLVRELRDGERIIIPARISEEEAAESEVISRAERSSEESTDLALESDKLDLNSATQAQLEELYRVGPVTAREIIAYREREGGFKSVEEIKEVSGIGERTYEEIKDELMLR